MTKVTVIKPFLKAMGFELEDGTLETWVKSYPNHNNYKICIDINNENIDYGSKIILGDKTTCNFKADENFVVLECVNRLLEKGYKPKNLTLEKRWATGHGTSGKLDILVKNDSGSSYLMIECKTYGTEFDKESKKLHRDGGQIFTYFQQDKDAEVLMLYTSKVISKSKLEYKNEIVKIEDDYKQTSNVKDFFDRWNKLTKNNGVFDNWVQPYDFQSKALTPKTLRTITQKDSGFIFHQFLEILRHNVVSDKPNAFNKIFTLFLCKIYDEKATKPNNELAFQWFHTNYKYEGISYPPDDNVSFQKRLADLYKKGMKEFLDKDVTDLSDAEFEKKYGAIDKATRKRILDDIVELRLKKNNEFAIKEVFDNDSFVENAKVVKAVVELLQGYQIRYNKKQQYLSDFFELLLTTGLKQESGQFFTPVPVAQFIIKSLPLDSIVKEKLEHGEKNNYLPTIIDYAAGSGHFITESMHEIQNIINSINPNDYISDTARKIKSWQADHFDWAYKYIYGIEKDYRLVKVGKVGCYLHGDGLAQIIHSDGLGNFKKTSEYKGLLKKTAKEDVRENKQFDILISNPPYSVSAFKNNARKYYNENDFDLYKKLTDQSSEIECLFIERTKQLLKDGGIAGIILPSSILSNTGIYTKAREIILKYFKIIAMVELGGNTFMATNTSTVTMFLRRRNNYEHQTIQQYLEKSIANKKDVTINNIQEPIKKYVDHAWDGIEYNDYITLLEKIPNKTIENHEIYQDYCKKIKAKNNEDFWKYVIDLETEKIFYFILAYDQKVIWVKSGEKKKEKEFLGYEFSNRRGNEGIHSIQRGKSIDECTKLFDPDIFDNPEKASTYIYKAFQGDFDSEIHESLQKNIRKIDLIDMFSFDRAEFEKTLSLSAKKKIKIDSKWKQIPFSNTLEKIIGNNTKIPQFDIKDNGKHPVITQEKEKLINGYSDHSKPIQDTPIVLFGDHSCTFKYIDFNFIRGADGTILLKPNSEFSSKYFYYILNFLIADLIENKEKYERHYKYLKNKKIPCPPPEIQNKIIEEMESLEKEEEVIRQNIHNQKKTIYSKFDMHVNKTKIGDIKLMLKRGKSPKYGDSKIQIIKSGQARGYKQFDFSQKYFVSRDFILDERKLEKGDILINSSGVGTAGRVTMFDLEGDFVADSHISILRLDPKKALPTYVLYALASIGFKTIELMATGQSGQIELSKSTI